MNHGETLEMQNPHIKRKNGSVLLKRISRTYQLYIFLIPAVIYYIVFKYVPIYGVQIAFRDYNFVQGFLGSPWVGILHFERFFNSPDFWLVIRNTISISVLNLIFGFPIPIIFALMLNQMTNKLYKRIIQTVSYAPYFISTVVLVGMMYIMLSPSYGLVNNLMASMGLKRVFFMAKPELFAAIYVLSGIWQNTGYSSVIYLAALSNISPELHEAAHMDGANKWQRIWHIDLPGILPTAVIMLILGAGTILTVGFEKNYLMQNALNRPAAEVISTFVYKRGITQGEFSYASAIGLFESSINFIILITVNKIAKRFSDSSLF